MRFLLLLLGLLVSFHASAGGPRGLFVQVGSVPTGTEAWKARKWFEAVCSHHRTPGAADYIHDLVLSDTGDVNGDLYTVQLDLVDDYFHCFDNVFMGTVDLPWAGESTGQSRYIHGIMDGGYRWNNILLSRKIADALVARYPAQPFHWYVTLEANLNYFTGSDLGGSGYSGTQIREAYKAYIQQLSEDLYQKRAGAVLWSPAFWSPYAALDSSTRTALAGSISNLLQATPRLTWLHFQDFVGQGSDVRCTGTNVCSPWQKPAYTFTCVDAVAYYGLLATTIPTTVASLAVNQEMFLFGADNNGAFKAMFPADPVELDARQQCYAQNAVPIGTSWEIRWWYLTRYGILTANVAYPSP
jgi:hypothetical protein